MDTSLSPQRLQLIKKECFVSNNLALHGIISGESAGKIFLIYFSSMMQGVKIKKTSGRSYRKPVHAGSIIEYNTYAGGNIVLTVKVLQ